MKEVAGEYCPICLSDKRATRGWRYISFDREFDERPWRLDQSVTGAPTEKCRNPWHEGSEGQ
jgi:hypothetical protein